MMIEKVQETTIHVTGDSEEVKKMIKEAEGKGMSLRLVADVPDNAFYKEKSARLERENRELKKKLKILLVNNDLITEQKAKLEERCGKLEKAYLEAIGL